MLDILVEILQGLVCSLGWHLQAVHSQEQDSLESCQQT